MSCKGCAYAVPLSGEWYCDYLSITGHRRPCPPGEGCTVRVEAEKDLKRKWKECLPVKGRTWDTDRARALYDEGLLDAEIAKEVGITERAVGFWRRTQGLPSNRDRPKADKAPPQEGTVPEAAPEPPLIHSPPGRPLALPALAGPVELSVEVRGCVFGLRAPDLEGLAWVYEYAGRLLRDMTKEAENEPEK